MTDKVAHFKGWLIAVLRLLIKSLMERQTENCQESGSVKYYQLNDFQ